MSTPEQNFNETSDSKSERRHRLAMTEIVGSVAMVGAGYIVDNSWFAIPAVLLWADSVRNIFKSQPE